MNQHWHDHEGHGGHPREWHGRRGRRFFRSGELHLVLLSLLAQRPQHGYELMSELEIVFGPAYTPSPGSIYPALNALEAEGLVEAADEGDRRVFSVTTTGRQGLVDRERVLAAIEARTGARLSGGALEPALSRLVARVRALASRVDHAEVERILDQAGDDIEAITEEKEE